MASTKVDLTAGEQVQGTLPLANGGTGATSLSGAGIEVQSNKNIASGYAGLNSSGYVAPGQLGSGSASSTTFLRGDNSWATPSGASGSTTPTASTPAEWDSNLNLSTNALLPAATSTNSTSITMTIASSPVQILTLTTGSQTVLLPTTGVPAGYQVWIISSAGGYGSAIVQSSSAASIVSLNGSSAGVFTALKATPTAATDWNYNVAALGKGGVFISRLTLSGTDGTIMNFPGASDTVVTLAASQSLTNKTLTSPALVTPALGTPASGTLTNCTFPTLNQSTTGNAATATTLATARNISGVAFDGSANVSVTGTLLPCQVLTVGTETFTIASGSVTQIAGTTVNGYTPAVGDRILVTNAPASTGTGVAFSLVSTPANGIYVVTSNTTNLSVSRSADMSGSVNPAGLTAFVENGSSFAGKSVLTVTTPSSAAAFTYGTGNIAWSSTGGLALAPNSIFLETFSSAFGWANGSGNTYLNPSSVSGTQTLTLPATATSDTLVGRASTDTLTNKTLTSPTLTTPVLGTPTSGTLTNCTGLPVAGGGTGVATLTGLVKGNGTSAFSAATAGTDYVSPGGALGTPSSGTLTNCTFPTLNQNTTGTSGGVSGGTAAPATFSPVQTVSAAGTLTLDTSHVSYVFTGTTTTWTLPAVSGNTGAVLFLESRGSGSITLNAAGSDHIWFLASLTTMTIGAGGSLVLINDGTYWNAMSIDLAHNSVGILPVANGGTGQANLTSLALTTPTVTGYTETVQALGTMGSTKTIPALSGGTVMTATLGVSTPCTFTMPTATAGQSFVLILHQAASGMTTSTFTSVKWPGGTAPTITATASAIDILTFFSDGTNWYGTAAQAFA